MKRYKIGLAVLIMGAGALVLLYPDSKHPDYEFLHGAAPFFTYPFDHKRSESVYLMNTPFTQVLAEATAELEQQGSSFQEQVQHGQVSATCWATTLWTFDEIEILPYPLDHTPAASAPGTQVQIEVREHNIGEMLRELGINLNL